MFRIAKHPADNRNGPEDSHRISYGCQNVAAVIFSGELRLLLFFVMIIHWCSKLKEQPVLSLTSFVHNSSVNEHKNMKLRENICYEMIH